MSANPQALSAAAASAAASLCTPSASTSSVPADVVAHGTGSGGECTTSFDLVGADPSCDEGFDEEALSYLRGVAARLGGAAVLDQALQGLALFGGVPVSHVVPESLDERECMNRIDAWRCSDSFQMFIEFGDRLAGLCYLEVLQFNSSGGAV